MCLRQDRIDKLRSLLSCPVNWEQELDHDCGLSLLQFDWQAALAENAVRREELIFDEGNEEFWLDESELENVIKNLELRHEPAKQTYMNRAGRLVGLRFIVASEHGKHFVPNLAPTEALTRTRNSRSLFFKNHSATELKRTFWAWFLWFFDNVTSLEDYEELITPETGLYGSTRGKLWRRFLKRHELRVCLDAIATIGGCNGIGTSFLCLDVHIDSKTVHGYPISRAEAVQIMGNDGILAVDVLSC